MDFNHDREQFGIIIFKKLQPPTGRPGLIDSSKDAGKAALMTFAGNTFKNGNRRIENEMSPSIRPHRNFAFSERKRNLFPKMRFAIMNCIATWNLLCES